MGGSRAARRQAPSGVRLVVREGQPGRGRRRDGTYRRRALAGLAGSVIEVGAGNGLNFRHYPAVRWKGGRVSAMPVRVGTSGWQYRDWRGVLYSAGLAEGGWVGDYPGPGGPGGNNGALFPPPPPGAVPPRGGQQPRGTPPVG